LAWIGNGKVAPAPVMSALADNVTAVNKIASSLFTEFSLL